MQILKVVFILFEVLVLFNILIFVHELGHFLAARWRGLKIDRFAIWFGKPIWKKTLNGVEYCLGSIPAGGYVALPQMAAMDTIEGRTEGKQEPLPPISVPDKIIVAFAGPLFSFGLALVFAVLVWFIGRPVSETETTTTVGYVFKGSPAEAAGLEAGDKILKVDGKSVSRFRGIGNTVTWRVVRSENDTLPITVQRGTRTLELVAKPIREKTEAWERRSLRKIMILPTQTALIAGIQPNSPAAVAKLHPNDIVIAMNGESIFSPFAIEEENRLNPDKPVQLTVKRGERQFDVTMKPVMPEGLANSPAIPKDEKYPRLGIVWELGGKMTVDHPAPATQIKASVDAMLGTLGAVLSRKSDIGLQHLSGPVGIVRIYYQLFESDQGWRMAIWFSVILNVNLALLNLLPIPVLDGGHITLALIEALRRRPVNLRLINYIQTSCALLIIGYMLFVTFFDAQDWRPWKRQPKLPEIRFKPPAEPAKP